jgi:PKD repeat protein
MNEPILKSMVFLVSVALMGGCTMKEQEPPPFAGPSEFGQSVNVAVSPDSLQQDGASQSLITVTVRDANGQPMRNVTLRVETSVGGTFADFGSLSARSIVTGADGRATVVYTAPAAPPVAVDDFTIVEIGATPIGTDFNNAVMASFTAVPRAPTDGQTVLFDASASRGTIAEYQWNFGDGGRSSGRLTQHAFSAAGTYVVTLTLVDPVGRSTSTAQSITVVAGVNPTAAFTFSPTNPRAGQQMTFNASASRPAAGAQIVSYRWEWGDGTDRVTTGDPLVAHTFGVARTYTVTLVVTDSNGRTASVSLTVQIAP